MLRVVGERSSRPIGTERTDRPGAGASLHHREDTAPYWGLR